MTSPKKITDFVLFNPKRTIKKGEIKPFVEMAALPIDSRDISKIGSRQYKGGGSRFQDGDTLFARITPCLENGKTAKTSGLGDGEIAHGSTEFIVMAAKEPEYDEDYIYYLARLPEFRTYAQSRMEGTSGRQRVSWQSLAEFEFNFPDKEDRKEIGRILKSIDDKICINNQQNQTLEQIAQAIFKSWFVDFEPVKAKMRAKANLPSPSGRGAGGEGGKIPPHLLKNARKLRQTATDAEQLLWQLLRNRQVNHAKFRRQHPMGQYILDFYCHPLKLAIELDGSQHNEPEQQQYDEQRTLWLNQQGIQVLRFWNNQVLLETEAVMDVIYGAVTSPSPLTPLPKGEGEHPSVTLAAMCAISGKDETALKQLQADQPEAYAELTQTAALFPSAMEDSELGEIPEGWAPIRIDTLLELAYGKALKKTDRINGNYPVYGSGGINGTHNKPLVSGPGIIVGRKGTVGSIYWEQQDYYPIDTVFYVKPRVGTSLEFCFYLLQTLGLSEMNTDAAVPGLNRNNVYRLEVPNYPEALITYFTRITSGFVNQISSNKSENTILSKTRDTLLPKLLSGEINLNQTQASAK
jgi:very-short-patch-repair endonuclease